MTFPDMPDRDPQLRSRAVIHPYERSRLTLAICCLAITSIVLLAVVIAALAHFADFLWFLFFILLIVGFIWFSHRLRRARLLGRAIKVTPESFPVIHAEFIGLQRKLDYGRSVDVYVADDVEGKMTMTSLLGTRVLLIEGDSPPTFSRRGLNLCASSWGLHRRAQGPAQSAGTSSGSSGRHEVDGFHQPMDPALLSRCDVHARPGWIPVFWKSGCLARCDSPAHRRQGNGS